MGWVDVCWSNVIRRGRLPGHDDASIARLRSLTYEVGNLVEAELSKTHRIEPMAAPVFNDVQADGTHVVRYADSHFVAPGGDAAAISSEITELVRSKPGNVFHPYVLLVSMAAAANDQDTARWVTRFAVTGT